LSGESLAALWAFAAAADFCAFRDRAGVDDSRIIMSAERANHFGVSPFEILEIPFFSCIGESAKLP
jgi:hypothetical protein